MRSGFTLVELLVAMLLTVFVMVILSQCFIAGLETFSGLKAIGDMQAELRAAAVLLQADLGQDHFEGRRRLSDPLTSYGGSENREGFFVIGAGYPCKPYPNPPVPPLTASSTIVAEGSEDGIASGRCTDHFLHFTSKMRGNQRDKFFAAPAPGLGGVITNFFNQARDAAFMDNANVLHSAWAEIVYLVLPTGTTESPSTPPAGPGPPTPLYALYRCQYVVLPRTSEANNQQLAVSPTDASPYTSLAGNPKVIAGPKVVMDFYNPSDLADGVRTFNPYAFFSPPPANNNNPPRGATLVLSNVISFQVMAMTQPGGDFGELGELATDSNPKPLLRRQYYIPFDTANYFTRPSIAAGVPFSPLNPAAPSYTIQGLQISMRIWDPRSQRTRQVTLIQDM